MTLRILVAALLLLPTALPVAADTVHLSNGETFEGVIADVQGDRVAIRLPHGVIRLPMSRVDRVERSSSPFEEYLTRSEALTGSTDAGEWLDLALWARGEELHSGMRAAALEAARLDPGLEGLEPLMDEVGFAFDEELGRWIPYADLMTRKGYVQVDGRWVPAEVVAEVTRRAQEEHERWLAEQRSARVDQAITLLALARLEESREERAPAVVVSPYGFSSAAPVAVLPGAWAPRGGHGAPGRGNPGARPGHGRRDPGATPPAGAPASRQDPAHNTVTWSDVARHQPGSIIPITPARTTSGHQRP